MYKTPAESLAQLAVSERDIFMRAVRLVKDAESMAKTHPSIPKAELDSARAQAVDTAWEFAKLLFNKPEKDEEFFPEDFERLLDYALAS